MRTSITLTLFFLGCGSTTQPETPAPEPAARVWSAGMSVCMASAHTEGGAPEGAASGCGMSVSMRGDGIFDEAFRLGHCGPCAFIYDPVTTTAERTSGHADACCYRGESPPPPPQ